MSEMHRSLGSKAQGQLARALGRARAKGSLSGAPASVERVQAQLRAHKHVAEATVRWLDTDEGKQLKAFVVPGADAPPEEALRRSLLAWLRHHLEPAEIPHAIGIGRTLPSAGMLESVD